MISELEQQTLDIDWFFTNGHDIAFVASGGGRLPISVAKSFKNNKLLASFFNSLPVISEVIINPNLNKIITNSVNGQYLADFELMAKKGFYTFDKTVLNNFSDSSYHLVFKPVNPIKVQQMPIEIKDALSSSCYDGNLESIIDITLVT